MKWWRGDGGGSGDCLSANSTRFFLSSLAFQIAHVRRALFYHYVLLFFGRFGYMRSDNDLRWCERSDTKLNGFAARICIGQMELHTGDPRCSSRRYFLFFSSSCFFFSSFSRLSQSFACFGFTSTFYFALYLH